MRLFIKVAIGALALGLAQPMTGARAAEGPSPTKTAKQALRETGQVVSDDWITTKVKSQLLMTGSGIGVQTSNHVVTLTGTVATEAQHQKAVSIARTTSGVTAVVDKIQTTPAK